MIRSFFAMILGIGLMGTAEAQHHHHHFFFYAPPVYYVQPPVYVQPQQIYYPPQVYYGQQQVQWVQVCYNRGPYPPACQLEQRLVQIGW
jgi:hypothetical protein